MKTAFLFGGQGSQYINMGRDLAENIEECNEVFEEANGVLDFDIRKLCFEDKQGRLNQTRYTQPAILTVNMIALRAIEKKIKPDMVAGLSLGEYSALIASGALDFKEGVSLVRKRGQFMEEAVPSNIGGMSAVLGLSKEELENTLNTITEGIVEASNFNCPGQIVIGGELKALKIAEEQLKLAGAKRVIPLTVSGPFHTSMLKGAAQKLEKELEGINFKDISIPVISNVNANYVKKKK